MKSNYEYILQFDGGSRGNPGHSAAGAVIYKVSQLTRSEIWKDSLYVGGDKTNNYAEYYGLIIGLEAAIKLKINHLFIQGDSLLIINQVTNKWRVKSIHLQVLYKMVKKLLLQIETVEFQHIRRKYNKRADELLNQKLDYVTNAQSAATI
jgi:ribonuclease HI